VSTLDAVFSGPLFAALSPLLSQIFTSSNAPFTPDAAKLDRLCAALAVDTASGRRLRFVPPQNDGLNYEARIWTCGDVVTRPDNWHDFFNALVWLSFPCAKAALNARHVQASALQTEGRGRERDAMTHFDECGAIVVSSDPELLDLLRDFRWQTLFWERRADLHKALRCFVFGHATYERLLAPFHGLTAKTMLFDVNADWLRAPLAEQIADVDRRLAGVFSAGGALQPRALHPLPLMGFPGMTPANECAEYYDDTRQFRPGRTRGGV
jgi:hypothetical protein